MVMNTRVHNSRNYLTSWKNIRFWTGLCPKKSVCMELVACCWIVFVVETHYLVPGNTSHLNKNTVKIWLFAWCLNFCPKCACYCHSHLGSIGRVGFVEKRPHLWFDVLPPRQCAREVILFEPEFPCQFLVARFLRIQVQSVQHRQGLLSISVLQHTDVYWSAVPHAHSLKNMEHNLNNNNNNNNNNKWH